MQVTIYTDGACSGNPGPGGYAAVLLYTDPLGQLHRRELSQGYRRTTNNRMEIMGVIAALSALNRPCEITLFSDSQYVVHAHTQGWLKKWQRLGWYKDTARKEKVKNEDLWQKLSLLTAQHEIHWNWVKGHAQDPENNRCDSLAVAAAADTQHAIEDTGFPE